MVKLSMFKVSLSLSYSPLVNFDLLNLSSPNVSVQIQSVAFVYLDLTFSLTKILTYFKTNSNNDISGVCQKQHLGPNRLLRLFRSNSFFPGSITCESSPSLQYLSDT